MTVICKLPEAGLRLSVSSRSYKRQVGEYLSAIGVRMTIICQLHEAAWPLFVRYMRQNDGKLSNTSGSLAVICQLY